MKRKLREMENDYWLQKTEVLQEAVVKNSAAFFKSLKELYGSQTVMSNAILSCDSTSVITEPAPLVRRWMEYFDGLLNAEAATEEESLQTLTPFPSQQELEKAPTLEQLNVTINQTKLNKSSGPDDKAPVVYKFGGEELTRRLQKSIGKYRHQRTLPQEFKYVLILPIY